MAEIYVAVSRSLQAWAGDVGLTKHVYKLGLAPDGAEAALSRLIADRCGGRTDWKLVRRQAVDSIDEATALARVAGRETAVDPDYYPQIKGAPGIFKVKLANVENHILLRQALAGEQPQSARMKPTDFADYLIRSACG
ncbi:MAG: hypothetical protein MUD06_01955 [Rhodospirillales bacterium]|jgi:hypothetical protein|nr:hypothetical protein [Rhodospirillales bacterium]